LRGGDYKGEIKGTCRRPWNTILIHRDLSVFICECDAWLPIPVGSVLDFHSIEEIFDSPKAKILQQDVADKKFTWCAVTHCGVVNRDIAANKLRLTINIDQSCNLTCPSCRRESIMIEEGPEMDLKLKCMERIFSWLDKYEKEVSITMSGSSDCLASPIFRPVIRTYEPKENQHFEIFTNGLLMKKILPGVPLFSAISNFKLSVDAGSAEVYKVVRQPGKWENLIDNLNWLDENRNPYTRVSLAFALQRSNYRDLINFVNFCNERKYQMEITQLDDWATWSSPSMPRGPNDLFTIKHGTFNDNNVLDPAHPEHNECLEILKVAMTMTLPSSFMESIKMLVAKN
jgi:hypothetical protein